MRARLAHRLVRVGGPEQPRGAADRGAGQPARIAGAVEPLAQLNGDRPERGERLGLVKHPLGQIRMHADALPLSSAQRAGAVPNRVRHSQSAEAVDETRPAQRSHLGLGEAKLLARACGEIGHRLGVPQPVRRLDVDRRRDGGQRSIELLARERGGQVTARRRSPTATGPPRRGLRRSRQHRGPAARRARGQTAFRPARGRVRRRRRSPPRAGRPRHARPAALRARRAESPLALSSPGQPRPSHRS